ncbi:MAG TPA: DUF11 domain-containing protein, partial [Rhodothermales bacterium]|nr:DUF11 domain-containing protein [Rhodothermales bacterium]
WRIPNAGLGRGGGGIEGGEAQWVDVQVATLGNSVRNTLEVRDCDQNLVAVASLKVGSNRIPVKSENAVGLVLSWAVSGEGAVLKSWVLGLKEPEEKASVQATVVANSMCNCSMTTPITNEADVLTPTASSLAPTSILSASATVTRLTRAIGAAKAIEFVKNNNNGTFDVRYRVTVQNLGSTTLSSVQVTDNLTTAFSGATFSIVAGSLSASAGLTINGSFNGGSDQNLLTAGGTLAPGGYGSIFFTVRVTPGANLGPYYNYVTATGVENGTTISDVSDNGTATDPNNNCNASEPGEDDPTPVTFTESPRIGISKRVTALTGTTAAFNVSFSMVVENFGTTPLSSVQVYDDLFAAFPGTSFTVSNLAATGTLAINSAYNGTTDVQLLNAASSTLAVGATGTISFDVAVTPGANTGPYYNTAVVGAFSPTGQPVADQSTDGPDPDPNATTYANDDGENILTPVIVPSPVMADVRVTKTVDNVAPRVGQNFMYTINVHNFGPSNATNLIVRDLLPASLTLVQANASQRNYTSGTGDWNIGSLPVGQSVILQLTVNTTSTSAVVNTAAVLSQTETDPVSGNNTSSVTILANNLADVSVSKTVSNAAPRVGETITFTIYAQNCGPQTATNVQITDLLPAGFTLVQANATQGTYNSTTGVWSVGTLGATCCKQAELHLTAIVNTSSPLTNTATVTGMDQTDPIPSNNTSSVAINPSNPVDISVTKTVNNLTPLLNEVVTFTISAQNLGPNPATGVAVTDLLPAALTLLQASPMVGTYASGTGIWTIGDLAVGQTAILQIAARVNATSAAITNTASVTAVTQTETITSNNTASATLLATNPADLRVAKTVSNLVPNIGDTVTFTVVVSNYGPNDASAVVVNDLLPAGLTYRQASATQGTYVSGTGVWTVGALPTGQSAMLQIAATVASSGSLSNTATVSNSPETDPVSSNNSSTATISGTAVTTTPMADVAVSKTADNLVPTVGQTVNFTITVRNNGPDTATGLQLTDVFPAGLTLAQSSATQGTFSSNIWNVGTLPIGGTATLQLATTLTTSGTITNSISVTAQTEIDP